MQKAFFKGRNLSCRLHICQHFTLYKKRCEKGNIPINHWAIPRSIWKKMEEEKGVKKQVTKKQVQQALSFKAVTGPREFTRVGILQSITELIATNNQASH
jgi:hypothetical protein